MYLSPRAVSSSINGELSGTMLVGLIQALKNVRVVSGEEASKLVEDIESDSWYPMTIFFALLDEVLGHEEVDMAPILFRAGEEFVQDWFAKFDGKKLFSSAGDFIRIQGRDGGYARVHRGDPQKIGWQEVAHFDESAGIAIVVCTTPYPREFERGIFYCGMLMADDVDFVRVESAEEPHSMGLSRKTHTIRFHKKAAGEADDALDAFLSDMSHGKPVSVPDELKAPLAWRLKALEERYRNDSRYFQQISLLLSGAASQAHELSRWALSRLPDRQKN